MGIILEFAGFYFYPWQNRLDEARACIAYAGYQISEEIAVGDNDIAFDVILPQGVDEMKARQKFLEVLNQSGFTLFLRQAAGGVITPPAPPELPWFAKLAIGTRLKVVRVGGLEVYTDPALSATWTRGRLPIGDVSMTLATPYDSAKDKTPPAGVLCVLTPRATFPAGLWIVATGNDELSNVEAV